MGYLEMHFNSMLSYLEKLERSYSIAFAKAPPGTLTCLNRNGHYEYFHSVPTEDRPKRYLRKGITRNPEMIGALADKEYSRRSLQIIRDDIKRIEGLKSKINDVDIDRIISSMGSAYRSLPEDSFSIVRSPDIRRSRQHDWANEEYEITDHRPEDRDKKTSRGLYVRTKAEALICEKCYELDIPFRYEQVVHIGNYRLAPDFTFLDANGEEFYLEYCGMMDDIDYVERYLWKVDKYHRAGIYEWDNLVFIFDRDNRIDMDRIERTIRQEILTRL